MQINNQLMSLQGAILYVQKTQTILFKGEHCGEFINYFNSKIIFINFYFQSTINNCNWFLYLTCLKLSYTQLGLLFGHIV